MSSEKYSRVMKLIHLAHRGEAQEFLKVLALKADPRQSGVYFDDSVVLVISGEGIPETISKLSYAISIYSPTDIINYGIAGSLSKRVEVNSFYEIRTSYLYEDDKPKFKSFTTQNDSSKIDCISTNQRVLSDMYADILSNFAGIVDRELWGVGFVAKSFNLPFRSFKLISDIAGESTHCFDLKERALEFSSALCEFYLTNINSPILENLVFTPPIIMSFSNRVRYQKLITNLNLKENITEEEILKSIEVENILEEKIRSKEKANQILAKLESKLNPINSIANDQIQNATKAFTNIGAKVKFDKALETKSFNLSIDINSQKNLDNLKRSIDIFDYKKIEKIWSGDLNV
jgi:nucleoside phosphorylase